MSEELKNMKDSLRAEAKRARCLLSLDLTGHENLRDLFFDNITLNKDSIIAAYWPKDRELDTHIIIDECLERDYKVALPVIEKDTRILKFAKFDNNTDLTEGAFGVCHPVINDKTEWLEPDIFIVPLLAFDRKGYRLGYGGGYYDATLSFHRQSKGVQAVGLAYAEQACLFNLPKEEHDIAMDWIITQQNAQKFN